MEEPRWERVQTLFHQVVDLPAPERRAFLEAACDDPEIVADVLALAAEDDAGNPLLDQGVAQVATKVVDGPAPAERTIGPYRILKVIGQGGMGVVYLAERDDLKSRAAIKLLRDAWLSPSRRDRFVREQQTLAQLSHPSIARLFDASTLADGTPYFVMEYIDGLSLTEYCRRQRRPLRERLHLFRTVCEAVQYAHRQAIIHRDLKPSNIMVTEGGTVKLLDFGIAKQIESIDRAAAQTRTGLQLMTPAYAAPEQITGSPVGVYTDVYALGVILYEILTDELPFDLSGLTPGQVETKILEQEPEKPSERVDQVPHPLVAKREWADLDVICLTAMHKDPQRRYQTVESLVRDIDHFLKGEPLEARPDSVAYRTGKFVRRNWRAVAATLLMAAGIAGIVTYYTVQLAASRDAALAEAARTQLIQSFMANLFAGGDEAVGPADTLRVVTLLQRGVSEAALLDAEPEVQAELFHTLGSLYHRLGDLATADSLLRRALDQRRMILGPEHPDVAASLLGLGLLRTDQAELDEAESLINESLELSRRRHPAGHSAVARGMTALGTVLQQRGDYDEAIALLEEAVQLQSYRGTPNDGLSSTMSELANTHYYAGDFAASDSLNRIVLEMNRRLYGERHPLIGDDLINLGAIQFEAGRFEEAEQLYRQALEIFEAYYGPDHPQTASNLTVIGRALVQQNRVDEALELLERALEVRERVFGPDHPRVASTLNEIGLVALSHGDYDVAREIFLRMEDLYRSIYGDEHYLVGIARANYASAYLDAGDFARAEFLFRDVLDIYDETLPENHINIAIAEVKLGRAILRQQRYQDAEPHTAAAHRILTAQAQPAAGWIRAARRDLLEIYEALGNTEGAMQMEEELAAMETAAQP